MPTDLKPCPFCGSRGEIIECLPVSADRMSHCYMHCGVCDMRGPESLTEAAATLAWNLRPTESEPKSVRVVGDGSGEPPGLPVSFAPRMAELLAEQESPVADAPTGVLIVDDPDGVPVELPRTFGRKMAELLDDELNSEDDMGDDSGNGSVSDWLKKVDARVQLLVDEHLRLCREQGVSPVEKGAGVDDAAESFFDLLIEDEVIVLVTQEIARRVMQQKGLDHG